MVRPLRSTEGESAGPQRQFDVGSGRCDSTTFVCIPARQHNAPSGQASAVSRLGMPTGPVPWLT